MCRDDDTPKRVGAALCGAGAIDLPPPATDETATLDGATAPTNEDPVAAVVAALVALNRSLLTTSLRSDSKLFEGTEVGCRPARRAITSPRPHHRHGGARARERETNARIERRSRGG